MVSHRKPINHQLFEYFHSGRKLEFEKGEIVLRAGDEPPGVYLIESGHIKVYSLSREGNEHTHVFYQPGDIFPVIWIFKDAIRNVYYQAIEPLTLWVVSKSDFKDFVSTNPQAAMTLLEQTTDMFRLYAGRIDNLLYPNSYERTAYRILSLMDRVGEQIGSEWHIGLHVTHQDIASSVNLSRETVSRAMERMQRKGFIGTDKNRRIVIKDPAGLMKIIGEDEAIGMWPQLSVYVT
jgi:CRP/FNR family transcriptional regulator